MCELTVHRIVLEQIRQVTELEQIIGAKESQKAPIGEES